jgi:hypothetical protein
MCGNAAQRGIEMSVWLVVPARPQLSCSSGNAIMLVHSATAPTAVLRTLPALDAGLWAPSLAAAWAARRAIPRPDG